MKLTHKVLTQRAKTVTFEYLWKNQKLAQDMLRFMRENGGIGLAATQVGLRKRIFVMEVQGWQRACFNPEITETSPEQVDWAEGCLSFPGEQCIIRRPQWIDVRYQDYQGHWHSERFTGILARCFQHELDHLNGKTMWDRHKEQHAEQP